MKTNIIQNIKAIILGLVLTVGMGYAAAQNFTGPTCSPTSNPGCNTPAPINVGGGTAGNIYSQIKTGLLTLDHLITPDLTVTNSDLSPVTAGEVLTAVNNTGKVGWATPGESPLKAFVSWKALAGNAGIVSNNYNIASVDPNGGSPKVVFASPLASANYSVVCNGSAGYAGADEAVYAHAKTTQYFIVNGQIGSGGDAVGQLDCAVYLGSGPIIDTTDTIAPTVPTGFTHVTPYQAKRQQALLSWTPSTDASGISSYTLYDTEDAGGEDFTYLLGISQTNNYVLTNPFKDTTRTFRITVVANDAVGNKSATSSVYTFSITR